jgi:hypothetical protein
VSKRVTLLKSVHEYICLGSSPLIDAVVPGIPADKAKPGVKELNASIEKAMEMEIGIFRDGQRGEVQARFK